MQSDPPSFPDSSFRSTTDVRDRPFPPVGLIVDGAVAEAMNIPFVVEGDDGVEVAHTSSKAGVGIIVVKRSNEYAVERQVSFDRTVEALAVHGIRQVISLSHRMLEAPVNQHYTNPVDGLTVGVLGFAACTRLLAAAFERTENEPFVDGLFLRDSDDENSPTLLHEADIARTNGFCVCLIEATTLRSELGSRSSEHRLAEIALHTPDAVSPLASCYCQNINIIRRPNPE